MCAVYNIQTHKVDIRDTQSIKERERVCGCLISCAAEAAAPKRKVNGAWSGDKASAFLNSPDKHGALSLSLSLRKTRGQRNRFLIIFTRRALFISSSSFPVSLSLSPLLYASFSLPLSLSLSLFLSTYIPIHFFFLHSFLFFPSSSSFSLHFLILMSWRLGTCLSIDRHRR